MEGLDLATHAITGVGAGGLTYAAIKVIPAIIKAWSGSKESDAKIAADRASEDRKAADWMRASLLERLNYQEEKFRELRGEIDEFQAERVENMMAIAKKEIANAALQAQIVLLQDQIAKLTTQLGERKL